MERELWKTIAVLGRYGHQPVNVVRCLPMREFWKLSDAVEEIMREEKIPSLDEE